MPGVPDIKLIRTDTFFSLFPYREGGRSPPFIFVKKFYIQNSRYKNIFPIYFYTNISIYNLFFFYISFALPLFPILFSIWLYSDRGLPVYVFLLNRYLPFGISGFVVSIRIKKIFQ